MKFSNPILIKEMRTRMRGKLAFLVLTGYVLILGAIVTLGYRGFITNAPTAVLNQAGWVLTAVLIFVQMVLICLVAPVLSASAISSEREQETFDLLVASLARPSTILFGKVGASLSYLLLTLFGSLPLVALTYSLGGVALGDTALAYLIMLVAGVTYGSLSFLWSTLIRRGWIALTTSLVAVFFLVVVMPLLGLTFLAITRSFTSGGPSPTVINVVFLFLRTNPFVAIAYLLIPGIPKPSALWAQSIPMWVSQVLFYLVITLLSLYLSLKRLDRVRKWL